MPYSKKDIERGVGHWVQRQYYGDLSPDSHLSVDEAISHAYMYADACYEPDRTWLLEWVRHKATEL